MAVKELQQPFDVRNRGKKSMEFDREVTFMQSVRHPHVLTFYGAGISSENRPFLVVELMEQGSLYALLSDPSRALSWRDRLQFALDIGAGMKYLHGIETVHRDLKSDNCFVSSDMRVKVGDFGTGRLMATVESNLPLTPQVSGILPSGSSASDLSSGRYGVPVCTMTRQTGSLLWMAPEVLAMEQIEQRLAWATDVYR